MHENIEITEDYLDEILDNNNIQMELSLTIYQKEVIQ